MHTKKLPMRKCLGCGEMLPKKELVRVVKTKTGEGEEDFEISLDLTGKKAGRGAYVCRKSGCLSLARKARRIERALSCRIPDEVYDRLEEEMRENEE